MFIVVGSVSAASGVVVSSAGINADEQRCDGDKEKSGLFHFAMDKNKEVRPTVYATTLERTSKMGIYT